MIVLISILIFTGLISYGYFTSSPAMHDARIDGDTIHLGYTSYHRDDIIGKSEAEVIKILGQPKSHARTSAEPDPSLPQDAHDRMRDVLMRSILEYSNFVVLINLNKRAYHISSAQDNQKPVESDSGQQEDRRQLSTEEYFIQAWLGKNKAEVKDRLGTTTNIGRTNSATWAPDATPEEKEAFIQNSVTETWTYPSWIFSFNERGQVIEVTKK